MSEQIYEDTSPGRDYYIQEDKHDLYKELQNSEESPFTEAELNEIFVFAVAYGSRKSRSDTNRWIWTCSIQSWRPQ